ncbi:type VI secretion system protein TssA [Microbulbifer sp. MKSA007]|nr:type VI secretion system protein TssA [Microbulbifer sp. MKSA007]
MAFPNTINIDELVAPISEDNPVGEDIREDRSPTSDYYSIKDARNSARAAERSAMFDDADTDLLAPWRDVAKAAENILGKKSKDLEVASWYTEALIRLHGFIGLRDGLQVIDSLVEQYWEGLYPLPDEDGLETKVAPLTGLNGDGGDGTLLMPIRSAGITPEGDYGDYSFFQFQQARDADRIADDDAKAARIETLGYNLEQIDQCVNSASGEWAQNLVQTIEAALGHFKTINDSLRQSCGHDAPHPRIFHLYWMRCCGQAVLFIRRTWSLWSRLKKMWRLNHQKCLLGKFKLEMQLQQRLLLWLPLL